MAEELQGLLDRIQKEGVERADAQAEQITTEAIAKAKTLLSDAHKEAAAILEKAKAESDLFRRRSESAIGHAARDIILSVGDAVTETLQGIVSRRVDGAMRPEALTDLIRDVIRAYCTADNATNIEVLLNERQKEAINAMFLKEFADAMRDGLTIRSSRGIVSGFRVELKDSGVQHDFTGEALTGAICKLLRPQLAEIVRNALRQRGGAAVS
jgi:V/A-type H+-transporting ATPase subunit E